MDRSGSYDRLSVLSLGYITIACARACLHRCCPIVDAVCCDDHEHCCPPGAWGGRGAAAARRGNGPGWGVAWRGVVWEGGRGAVEYLQHYGLLLLQLLAAAA